MTHSRKIAPAAALAAALAVAVAMPARAAQQPGPPPQTPAPGTPARGSGSEAGGKAPVFGPDGTVTFPDGRTIVPGLGMVPAGAPADLKAALDAAVWDPVERGPLIAVAPDTVRPRRAPSGPDGETPPIKWPEKTPDGRYRLPDLADLFGRRVVRLSGLTVCAPATLVELNPHPDAGDPYAGEGMPGKLRRLAGTLTEAQWKAFGSEQGLGAADLDPAQRTLFLSLLPDPLLIEKAERPGLGSIVYGGRTGEDRPTVVSAADRAGIRLRLDLEASYHLMFDGHPEFPAGGMENIGQSSGLVNVIARPRPQPGVVVTTRTNGQEIRRDVPSHLKQQQIDFAAASLNAPVALDGAQTVGDLVARIRQATRIEVYVDGRMGEKAVWARAGAQDTVRAGELLKALCWAMSGAVRHVWQGVFILTDDVEGYGTRMARLAEWQGPLDELQSRLRMDADRRIREASPYRFLHFADGDPLAPSAEVQKSIEANWKQPGRVRGVAVPIASLAAPLQDDIRKAIKKWSKGSVTLNGQPAAYSTTQALVMEGARVKFLIPGIGEVLDQEGGGFSSSDSLFPQPDFSTPQPGGAPRPVYPDVVTVPASFSLGTVVWVAPDSADAARLAVRAARKHGMAQVWLSVPAPASPDAAAMEKATADGKALLAAAITEAAAAKPAVSVIAVAPVLTLAPPPGEPGAAPPLAAPAGPAAVSGEPAIDVTVQGETERAWALRRYAAAKAVLPDTSMERYYLGRIRDWLNPAAPGLAARLTRRFQDLSRTPGLAGLALMDAAAPGYGSPDSTSLSLSFGGPGVVAEVGYTPAQRLALVRSRSYDPVDIGRAPFGIAMAMPFFGADPAPFSGGRRTQGAVNPDDFWRAQRYETTARFLGEVFRGLSAARGASAPLYLRAVTSSGPYDTNDWFARWTKADSLPRSLLAKVGANQPPPSADESARQFSAENLLVYTYQRFPRTSYLQKSPENEIPEGVRLAHDANSRLSFTKGAWRGLVLNLTTLPCADALTLLDGALPARP